MVWLGFMEPKPGVDTWLGMFFRWLLDTPGRDLKE